MIRRGLANNCDALNDERRERLLSRVLNMDNPITVSFQWSVKEMLLVQRLHMRYSKQGRKLRRILIGLGALFMIMGIAGLVQRKDFFASAFPFVVAAGAWLVVHLSMRRAVLKMYAQKPDRDMLITYEISADRLATRSEVASSEVLWRTIIRGHRVPQGFLLYPTDLSFHWLPVHGFHDAADVERLAQLIKLNVQQYDHYERRTGKAKNPGSH